LWAADGSRKQTEVEVPPCDPRHGRECLPREVVLQHRRLTPRRPGTPSMGSLAQSRFVDEDDRAALFLGVFFSSGQRACFHRRTALSLRSRARPTGRWQLHPNWRRMRHTWTVVNRIPLSRSIKSATRQLVHSPVSYPSASGPCFRPATIRLRSASLNRGLRPGRGDLRNASRPSAANWRAQRLTDWRCTPTLRAVSASLQPFCSNRAALNRRRSNATKFRFAPARFPMPDTVTQMPSVVTILCNIQ